MRITDNMRVNTLLYNLQRRSETLNTYMEQLTTGKALNRPSDDPLGTEKGLAYRQRIAQNQQYQRNIEDGLSYLGYTDNTLDTVGNLLQQARSAAIQGDNDNLTAADRAVLATEVDQILEQLFNAANTQFNGKFIFAGYNNDTAPFIAERDASGNIISVSANPAGIDDEIKREIGQGVYESINVGGSALFQPDGAGADTDMFNSLIALRDALNANDTEAIGPQIDHLTAAIEQENFHRSLVGEKVTYLETRLGQLQTLEVTLTEGLSKVEDADYTEAVMNYELESNAYNAALAAGSQIMQLSLLDYL